MLSGWQAGARPGPWPGRLAKLGRCRSPLQEEAAAELEAVRKEAAAAAEKAAQEAEEKVGEEGWVHQAGCRELPRCRREAVALEPSFVAI